MSKFIHDAKKDVAKFLKSAGDKVEEIAENTKMNLEVYSLEREKNQILLLIGKVIYKMFLKGQIETSKIDKELKKVMDIEEEIKKVKEKGGRKGH